MQERERDKEEGSVVTSGQWETHTEFRKFCHLARPVFTASRLCLAPSSLFSTSCLNFRARLLQLSVSFCRRARSVVSWGQGRKLSHTAVYLGCKDS